MFDQFERQFWSGRPELTGCVGRIMCEPEVISYCAVGDIVDLAFK